jgi:hypothetical protein
MRIVLWIIVLLVSSFGVAQDCTTYALLDAFDQKTTLGIDGLKAQDFEAEMGNRLLPVLSVTQNLNSRVLVLAEVDNSIPGNSIAELQEMIDRAPAERPIAVGVFAGRALFTKEFSINPEQRKTSMKELIAQSPSLGNHSAVFDALHQALSLFGEHQPGDTILLMSHPSDFHSHRNGVDLEKEFLSRGTRLLFIFKPFNPAKGWGAITQYSNLRELKRLVSTTGGMYTTYRNKDFLSFAWAGYLLELKLPVDLDKPKEWQLKLRGTTAKTHKDALMVYPRKLPPCHATVASR